MKEKGMKEEKELCGSAVLRFRGFAVLRQILNFVVVCVGSVDLQLCAFVWVSWAWK